MGSSTGDLLVDDDKSLDRIFSSGERLIAVHAEDEERINQRTAAILSDSSGSVTHQLHSEIRDPQTALIATQRALELSDKYGRRLHILHLSTAIEVEHLRQHKAAQVSCEVIPNHLFLNTDDYVRRSEEHTSELQSQAYLVCRLLLEKKNNLLLLNLHSYHPS